MIFSNVFPLRRTKHCTSTGCPIGPYQFRFCVSHKVMCLFTDVTPFGHFLIYTFKTVSLKNATIISIYYVGALQTCCILNVITESAELQQTASQYTRKLFRNSGPISQRTQCVSVTKTCLTENTRHPPNQEQSINASQGKSLSFFYESQKLIMTPVLSCEASR